MCGWAVFTGIQGLGSQTWRCVTPSPLVGRGHGDLSSYGWDWETVYFSDRLSDNGDTAWTAVTRPCNGGSQLWLQISINEELLKLLMAGCTPPMTSEYICIYISEGGAVASVVSKALHAVPAQVAFVGWGLGESWVDHGTPSYHFEDLPKVCCSYHCLTVSELNEQLPLVFPCFWRTLWSFPRFPPPTRLCSTCLSAAESQLKPSRIFSLFSIDPWPPVSTASCPQFFMAVRGLDEKTISSSCGAGVLNPTAHYSHQGQFWFIGSGAGPCASGVWEAPWEILMWTRGGEPGYKIKINFKKNSIFFNILKLDLKKLKMLVRQ